MEFWELVKELGGWGVCVLLVLEFFRRWDSGKIVSGREYERILEDRKETAQDAAAIALEFRTLQAEERQRSLDEVERLTGALEKIAGALPERGAKS